MLTRLLAYGAALTMALFLAASAAAVPEGWKRNALCVHRLEGSWDDAGAPYYGGMQMDLAFMRHYGRWALRHLGTADHWSPARQLRVAYRGWKKQGWYAWPNTARVCGLI